MKSAAIVGLAVATLAVLAGGALTVGVRAIAGSEPAPVARSASVPVPVTVPSANLGASTSSTSSAASAASGPGTAGPSHGGARTAIGLTVAAVLVAVAGWLWRRTDWTPPSEASTPAVDATTLQRKA